MTVINVTRPERLLFEGVPAIGTVLEYQGQQYEFLGAESCTKADGTPGRYFRWRSHCLTCGQLFEETTGATFKYLARRCSLHRRGSCCGRPKSEKGRIDLAIKTLVAAGLITVGPSGIEVVR